MWRRPSMESSNHQPPDGYTTTVTDDFLEQILDIPSSYSGLTVNGDVVVGGDTVSLTSAVSALNHYHHQQQSQLFPLGLSLENGGDDAGAAFDLKTDRELVNMRNMYPMFESSQPPAIHHHVVPSHVHQSFLGQPTHTTAVNVAQPPAIRPRVRARRGQATDPHSIAERLRRERISEKIKALQELVPSCNKTDRAAMLDEILDYVKFLRLQVKVLSMSRLGGAGAVAQLVSDIPRSIEGENGSCGPGVWEKWSNEETEQEVAKLMEEDVGAAMQFLQTKSLCIMPVSLAALVYPTTQQQQRDVDPSFFKPEPPALS